MREKEVKKKGGGGEEIQPHSYGSFQGYEWYSLAPLSTIYSKFIPTSAIASVGLGVLFCRVILALIPDRPEHLVITTLLGQGC